MENEKKKVKAIKVKPVATPNPIDVDKTTKTLFEEPLKAEPIISSDEVQVKNNAPKKQPSTPVYKQWWFWLILAGLILAAVALLTQGNTGKDTNAQIVSSTEVSAVTDAEDSDSINVDENLLTVDVTLPPAFFEDETPEEIEAAAKENGFLKCVVHEDGSVTYTMTKLKRAEILRDFKGTIDESITELTSGGENEPQSFRSIIYNAGVTQFDVRVDRTAYENSWLGSFYIIQLYLLGGYYQLFNGVPNEQIDVIVNVIDDSSGEVFNTGSYQQAMANLSE